LRAGHREREPLANALVEQFVDAEDRRRQPAVAEPLADAQAQLHEHQLVVHESPPRLLCFPHVRGAVDEPVGISPADHMALLEQLKLEPLFDARDRLVEVRVDDLSDVVAAEARAGGVDWTELLFLDDGRLIADLLPLGVDHLRHIAAHLHSPLNAKQFPGMNRLADV
jgi:hypothetical protein